MLKSDSHDKKNSADDTNNNSRRRRPTIEEQSEIKKTLRLHFRRGFTIDAVHEITEYDPKTISKYFKDFTEEIEKDETKNFLERQREELRSTKLRYEYLIIEEFQMLDAINSDIKKCRKENGPDLTYFLGRHSDIIKTITNLTEKKSVLGIHPRADESLDKIIEEKVIKFEELRKRHKR